MDKLEIILFIIFGVACLIAIYFAIRDRKRQIDQLDKEFEERIKEIYEER